VRGGRLDLALGELVWLDSTTGCYLFAKTEKFGVAHGAFGPGLDAPSFGWTTDIGSEHFTTSAS
jgi:hypothetical protein